MSQPWKLATATALLSGMTVGWLDVRAAEVQGPLLALMLATFIVALVTRAPAWLLAIAAGAGLPIGHLVSRAAGEGGDAHWGMLVACIPALLAAYGGRWISTLIQSTTTTLTGAETTNDNDAWYERPASPPYLLGVALFGCAAIGAAPVYAVSVARGQPIAWWVTTIWQIISFVAWTLTAPLVLRIWNSRRRDDAPGVTPAELATHAAFVTAIALLHALALPLLTSALFIPLGSSGIGGAATWSLAAYLPLDALTYCLVVGLGHASDANRRARAAATRESAVRGELASSRLATLRAQLRPHFLFNALNAATVLTRRGDADAASRVLTELADLLRYVLRDTDAEGRGEFVRLGDELAFAESYLAIERDRVPDRLLKSTEVTDDARLALVPHLLLQPLVENAVRHGVGARVGVGTVTIRARRVDALLHISVEDDGPGPRSNNSHNQAHGIGLSNSRARLATLYGDRAELTLAARTGGGARARVIIPYTT